MGYGSLPVSKSRQGRRLPRIDSNMVGEHSSGDDIEANAPDVMIMSPKSSFNEHRQSQSGRFRLRRSGTIQLASKNYQEELPGQEPGLDPNDSRVKLHTQCGITVVDFSEDDIVQTELGNTDLLEFLEKPRADWVGVRWINCNGQPDSCG